MTSVEITDHRLYKHSSESMHEIKDNSIELGVTSPPYNTNKAYGQENRLNPNGQTITREKNSDAEPWSRYCVKHTKIVSEVFRVLVPGGRFVVNVGNVGGNMIKNGTEYSTLPLFMLWWTICTSVGFKFEGEIIWAKKNGTKSSAHGSWRTYTRPVIQDIHEYILVFTKPHPETRSIIMEKDITHERFTMDKIEFLDLTKSLWYIETKSHPVHPAVFPDELARRLIRLYTGPGHTVLDPFGGSGTTARVAKEEGRNSISYEIEELYHPLIEDVTLQRDIRTWFEEQPTPQTEVS